jgi:hypothetical protein
MTVVCRFLPPTQRTSVSPILGKQTLELDESAAEYARSGHAVRLNALAFNHSHLLRETTLNP